MPELKTAGVRVLVHDALRNVARPYGEDVILRVFQVIERDDTMLARYRDLKAELGPDVLNQWVGKYTRRLTDMDTVTEVDTKGSALIVSYTKLRPRS